MKRKPLEIGIFEDAEIVKKYDKEAGKWMRRVAKSFVAVAKKWGVTSGKVLDVGTGTGILAIEFAKEIPGVEVVGLDLSDIVLELAREKAQKSEASPRVSFKKGDAEDMPFENDTFDMVISGNTLHLIKNPIRMLNEIQRVLKTDGKFLISDHKRSLWGIFSEHLRAAYTPKEVEDLLKQSKLQNWKVKNYIFWLSIISKE